MLYCAATASIHKQGQFSGILKLLEELLELFDESHLIVNSRLVDHRIIKNLAPSSTTAVSKCENTAGNEQAVSSNELQSWLTHAMGKHPFLLGDRTLYGVMPDWNPAEIIGLRPYPLALSPTRS